MTDSHHPMCSKLRRMPECGCWERAALDLRRAHAAAEAERIALADAFRARLEGQGMSPMMAALEVQQIIDVAAANHAGSR